MKAIIVACLFVVSLLSGGCRSPVSSQPVARDQIGEFWWTRTFDTLYSGTFYRGTANGLHYFEIRRRFPGQAESFCLRDDDFTVPEKRSLNSTRVECFQWFADEFLEAVPPQEAEGLSSKILNLPQNVVSAGVQYRLKEKKAEPGATDNPGDAQ